MVPKYPCVCQSLRCVLQGERSSDHVAKYGPHLPFQIEWYTVMPSHLNSIYCSFGTAVTEVGKDGVACRT